ncbi:MAG: T9SS type A sorting domain-containing protein [Ignavibacteria bacterium]
MNKILILIFYLFFTGISYGVNPEYILKAGNAVQTSANSLEFDIVMIHTNSSNSTFEYAGGQYFFDFNLNISNGGALIYSIVDSDLPLELQPRNPLVYTSGGEMQLRLSTNVIPSPGQGFVISDLLPGTKLVRMKLMTNSGSFDVQYFSLRWRNGPANPYTKIYSFENSVFTEITDTSNHSIDSLNHPLPIELTAFNSVINGNNTELKWSTNSELNNFGFEIERKESTEQSFKKIGFIQGAGTSNIIINYSYTDKYLSSGTYNYRLKQIDYNGNFTYFELDNFVNIGIPSVCNLEQNFPNPFNPETIIRYQLSSERNVSLKIYSNLGKEIIQLVKSFQPAGSYAIKFDGNNLSGGVYFYRLEAGDYIETKRMLLVK